MFFITVTVLVSLYIADAIRSIEEILAKANRVPVENVLHPCVISSTAFFCTLNRFFPVEAFVDYFHSY